MKNPFSLLFTSLRFVAVVSALSILYGFAVKGVFTTEFLLPANYLAGVFIVSVGMFFVLAPSLFKDGLIDRFLGGGKSGSDGPAERQVNKQERATEVIYLGVFIVFFAGLMRLIIYLSR